jgi:hypothetical protein
MAVAAIRTGNVQLRRLGLKRKRRSLQSSLAIQAQQALASFGKYGQMLLKGCMGGVK